MDNMAKKMLIDATHAEETRVVVVDGNKVEEFDFESAARRQLAGNIYLAKVTRVEPSLQAAFIDYGGNRHGFLAFAEIHPDYYQIPVADREALLAEEMADAQAEGDDEIDRDERRSGGNGGSSRGGRSRSRSRSQAARRTSDPVARQETSGLDVIDLGEDDDADRDDLVAMDGGTAAAVEAKDEAPDTAAEEKPAPRRRTRSRGRKPAETDAPAENDGDKESDDLEIVDKDTTIETVANEDDTDDVRPVRKPRARRYKIQEVVKVRQIMLVQVVKEERGNKGAALTTYLSLAGRYCVLMPNTARGGGISRKITNLVDRKKLKEIANEIEVPRGAGLIIRTAGSQRTRAEIKRDYEYLQRLWEQIRELTLKSIAPAKIYEEGDLIKRSIRDLYSKDIDEVLVEGAEGYKVAKDFMKMIMPSHAKNVKLHTEGLPLFARHQVEGYLAAMFNPTVQLPSGGYIVIGITEALVAIDVNSGRATKEGSIEQTALKTNLEASDEVARQLRLRDLAGLIVIDYIDMDERKNNAAVEKRFKDALKDDRARIQVGRISGFGLLEMSRQRLRPGMLEATTQPCVHCHGTGLLRSDDNVSLGILRQLEEEGVRARSKEVLLRVPFGIMNFLVNQKREMIAQIEMRYGMAVRIEGDPTLVSPDFAIEKFKTATRVVPDAAAFVSANAALMADVEDEDDEIVEEMDEDDVPEAAVAAPAPREAAPADEGGEGGEDRPKKKRRRRRRRRGAGGENGAEGQNDDDNDNGTDDESDEPAEGAEAQVVDVDAKPRRTRSRSRKPAADVEDTPVAAAEATVETTEAETEAEAAPKPRRRSRARKPAAETAAEPQEAGATTAPAEEGTEEAAPKPKRRSRAKKPAVETMPVTAPEAVEAAAPEEAAPVPETAPARAPETKAMPVEPANAEEVAAEEPPQTDAPKRRGWWSLGRS